MWKSYQDKVLSAHSKWLLKELNETIRKTIKLSFGVESKQGDQSKLPGNIAKQMGGIL
jgi:hypothetical protein